MKNSSATGWRGGKISEVVISKSRVQIELGDLNSFSQPTKSENVQVMIVTRVIIGNSLVKNISFKKQSMNLILQSPFVVYEIDSKRERFG